MIDAELARRLVADQFPQWADLPVTPVDEGGWDNRTFRLGDAMTVRLPSAEGYAASVAKEQRWLPVLAPRLPLPIPVPLGHGRPGPGYPYPWSVYRWLDGHAARPDRIGDLVRFATDLAGFLTALYGIDATGGPAAGDHSFHRGNPPLFYDGETRAAIAALPDRALSRACTDVWETALATRWTGRPVWFHGDVAGGNLLVRDGRLVGVIDFGTSGVGDPASDTAIFWTLLTGEARAAFRAGLPLADDTWARGRGWVLWKSLITDDHATLAEVLATG